MSAFALLLATALLTVLAVDLLCRLATRRHWYDHPNERSSHAAPTPRIGGVGFALVFCAVALVSIPFAAPFWIVLLASLPLLGVCLRDDWGHVPQRWKVLAQLLSAGLVLWLLPGWRETALPLLGILPVIFSLPLLVLWAMGAMNAQNNMDGTDGIAAGQGLVVAAAWALWFQHHGAPDAALANMLLVGALLGFLVWNRPDARVFMGDTGSNFLGLWTASMPLLAIHLGADGREAFSLAVLAFWPFIVDAGWTFLRALPVLKGRVFEAHRRHLYQRMAASFPRRATGHALVMGLYILLAAAGAMLHLAAMPFAWKIALLIPVWILLSIWVHRRQPVIYPTA